MARIALPLALLASQTACLYYRMYHECDFTGSSSQSCWQQQPILQHAQPVQVSLNGPMQGTSARLGVHSSRITAVNGFIVSLIPSTTCMPAAWGAGHFPNLPRSTAAVQAMGHCCCRHPQSLLPAWDAPAAFQAVAISSRLMPSHLSRVHSQQWQEQHRQKQRS